MSHGQTRSNYQVRAQTAIWSGSYITVARFHSQKTKVNIYWVNGGVIQPHSWWMFQVNLINNNDWHHKSGIGWFPLPAQSDRWADPSVMWHYSEGFVLLTVWKLTKPHEKATMLQSAAPSWISRLKHTLEGISHEIMGSVVFIFNKHHCWKDGLS